MVFTVGADLLEEAEIGILKAIGGVEHLAQLLLAAVAVDDVEIIKRGIFIAAQPGGVIGVAGDILAAADSFDSLLVESLVSVVVSLGNCEVVHGDVQQAFVDKAGIQLDLALEIAKSLGSLEMQAEHRRVDDMGFGRGLLAAVRCGDSLDGRTLGVNGEDHQVRGLGGFVLGAVLGVAGGNLQQVDGVSAGRLVKGGDAVGIGLAHHALGVGAELHHYALNGDTGFVNDLDLIAAVGKCAGAEHGQHHAEHQDHCNCFLHFS